MTEGMITVKILRKTAALCLCLLLTAFAVAEGSISVGLTSGGALEVSWSGAGCESCELTIYRDGWPLCARSAEGDSGTLYFDIGDNPGTYKARLKTDSGCVTSGEVTLSRTEEPEGTPEPAAQPEPTQAPDAAESPAMPDDPADAPEPVTPEAEDAEQPDDGESPECDPGENGQPGCEATPETGEALLPDGDGQPTEAPEVTPTPEPTATVTPTPAPTPTATVRPTATPVPTAQPVHTSTPTAAPSREEEVISQVNAERAKQGLQPLSVSAELSRAAAVRAAEIAVSFSHTRPDGTPWTTVSDYAYGENIAMGQRTADKVMAAWMSSSGHRANILHANYGTIGVCAYVSGGVTYWVQLFGK